MASPSNATSLFFSLFLSAARTLPTKLHALFEKVKVVAFSKWGIAAAALFLAGAYFGCAGAAVLASLGFLLTGLYFRRERSPGHSQPPPQPISPSLPETGLLSQIIAVHDKQEKNQKVFDETQQFLSSSVREWRSLVGKGILITEAPRHAVVEPCEPLATGRIAVCRESFGEGIINMRGLGLNPLVVIPVPEKNQAAFDVAAQEEVMRITDVYPVFLKLETEVSSFSIPEKGGVFVLSACLLRSGIENAYRFLEKEQRVRFDLFAYAPCCLKEPETELLNKIGTGIEHEKLCQKMEEKIEAALRTAIACKYDSVLFGALDRDVWGIDPVIAAHCFKKVLVDKDLQKAFKLVRFSTDCNSHSAPEPLYFKIFHKAFSPPSKQLQD